MLGKAYRPYQIKLFAIYHDSLVTVNDYSAIEIIFLVSVHLLASLVVSILMGARDFFLSCYFYTVSDTFAARCWPSAGSDFSRKLAAREPLGTSVGLRDPGREVNEM